MGCYVLGLQEIDQTQVALVGGKGAHLGELSRIDGIRVPAGFCVTTDAFLRLMAEAPSINEQLRQLSRLKPDDREQLRALSAELRRTLEGTAIPDDVAEAITHALARLGEHAAYAVRSSATAEDLPTASFAGQQDTYLNVVGTAAILQHVSRCWASLFTERAVIYRLRNGFDHRKVRMAVVVQQMVFPQAAGILFTADPITSHRKVTSVEASFGLGEALVSGLVNADSYKVRDGEVISKAIGTKQRAIHALPAGGTQEQAIAPERQRQPALTDAQVVRLAQLGRQIEAHFGRPQDIEWCFVDDAFFFVQSRPITTLFPIPEASDRENHVYVSVGHQQMMTDAMKPLGLSLFQLTALRPMLEAGGRLFVDITQLLASPSGRAVLVDGLGKSDPLIRDALQTLMGRGDFIRPLPDASPGRPPAGGAPAPIETDPAIVDELIGRSQASIAALKRDIQTKSGPALFDFILTDIQELKRLLFEPRSHQVIMAGMEATWWLNDQLQAWLGEKNAADTLTQSVPNNVTSEMGLALLEVADVIRPHPEVVAFLRQVEDDGFLDPLDTLPGGREARDAIRAYLDKYGMRCVGEIDITKPRWSERPTTLVPILLGNIQNFEPGAGARRFEQGRQEAWKKEQELLARLRALPDGEGKAAETKRMIDRVRTFMGYREYPKYGIVSRYSVYKQALLEEAARLVQAHVLRDKEDIFYLTLQELHDVVRTHQVDDLLIRQRKDAFRSYQALTPPRVLTSEGEVIAGAYRRDDLPAGALVGLAVSAGTIEGRARVILDMSEARLEAGDILVTAFTDPSWTPLFVSIKGLVTEVGGLMTHGAVIAREYGLPAVVGVEQATRLIRDGQRIRVHGTDGYVELLSQPDEALRR
ncbi:phosphoenolpyruvate synthase [Corallococcus coralloides DSM 2259]|uniref:Prodigiosin synthesizing transferase PigC n=1 Tax=Corallococcus coralloides (strain ATCC 25202 / DSM 2259 / NBRC 100086 / M2) TaxID=1144275 RepID=H8MF61_CORCM|nr:rifamycin-inactivating phosphotransferase [Corallococcus coralloides]AFE09958.1 phosphoenolpyruvate synthase [Corallococcus coralloides DSM 2259]